jgi:hypothetical protein
LEWLKTFVKQDDICDTILMILAYNKECRCLPIE